MCASLRRTRSQSPSPELRLGWAESPKIRPMSRRGGAKRPTSAIRSNTKAVLTISTKGPYALRALVELGRHGPGPVPIGELARRRDIPVQFLEQLFAVLRRAGILRSQRGVKGGYAFAREPSEVTVLEVVELLDGRLGAEAEGLFAEAATAARTVLAQATVADV